MMYLLHMHKLVFEMIEFLAAFSLFCTIHFNTHICFRFIPVRFVDLQVFRDSIML